MPWASTAITVGSSVLGGLFGGKGKKKAAQEAARAAAAQEARIAALQAQNRLDTKPYREAGEGAQGLLSDLLGTATPEGYAARPNYDDIYARVVAPPRPNTFAHGAGFLDPGIGFLDYGVRGLNRQDGYRDKQNRTNQATAEHQQALSNWEKGLVEYKAKNPNARTGSGSLLKPFSNEDFVKDPGYLSRLLEGEQGEQRNLVSRGMSDSGQALKELERYRQTYASNEFGNAYNRDAANKARTYDFLSGQTSQGLNAINGGASLGTNLSGLSAQNSQNNSANMLNQANLRDENTGNAFQSAISNLIYGMNRNSGRTPPYIPETGGYSTPPAGSFAKLFL